MKKVLVVLAMGALTFSMNAQVDKGEVMFIYSNSGTMVADAAGGYNYGINYVTKHGITLGVGRHLNYSVESTYISGYSIPTVTVFEGMSYTIGYTAKKTQPTGLQFLLTVLTSPEVSAPDLAGIQMTMGWRLDWFVPSLNYNSFQGIGVGAAIIF